MAELAGMDALKRTPLHAFHQRHGARLVPFAGWEMPVQYGSILEEHRSVRSAAGLFDVSHMGEVLITGRESIAFLNRLVTNDVRALAVGHAQYAMMCYPDGGVVDDLIIYRLEEERFLVVINASNVEKDLEWMRGHAVGYGCRLEDASERYALLALQGPKAFAVLAAVGGRLDDLPRFGVTETSLDGASVIVSRTGYTGEDGVEIFVAPDRAEALAETLLAAGAPEGLALIGLGARDSLRLEAGLPLYGHELSTSITPLQAGFGWVVKLGKTVEFLGKSALAEEKRVGPRRRVRWFRLDDRRIAREGTPVLSGDQVVGRVLSGSLSPLLNAPIGSALVAAEADPGTLAVDLRGTRVALQCVRPPLHRS
jgi:aminomethyltransferase